MRWMKEREIQGKGKESYTDFDGGDAEAAGLKNDADAAGGDSLAETANHTAGDQNVLHSSVHLSLSPFLLG
jgi:hypothetical protein